MAVEGIDVSRSGPRAERRALATPMVVVFVFAAVFAVVGVAWFPVMFHRLHVVSQISAVSADPFSLTVAKAQSLVSAGNHSDHQVRTIANLVILAELLLGVAFIFWFHRAYANLSALGVGALSRTKGWAIGAWFIPFGAMVIPKQMTDELWRASDPSAPTELPNRRAPVPTLVHAWWVTWVGGGLLNVVFRLLIDHHNHTPGEIRTQTWAFIVSDVLWLISLVLMIGVVRQITRRQDERSRLRAAAGL